VHPGLALVESKNYLPQLSEIGLNVRSPNELNFPVKNEKINFFSHKKLSLQSNAEDL
jgi:hypothetical protein